MVRTLFLAPTMRKPLSCKPSCGDSEPTDNATGCPAKAGEIVIAASKNCCWCCDWLSQNLESQFTLPGTHGVIYPWGPQKAGVSEIVLKRLEDELWKNCMKRYRATSHFYIISCNDPSTWCPTDTPAVESSWYSFAFVPLC